MHMNLGEKYVRLVNILEVLDLWCLFGALSSCGSSVGSNKEKQGICGDHTIMRCRNL